MNDRCMSELALMRVESELASGSERDHVSRCPACAARYRTLILDLADITGVVLGPAPAASVHVRARAAWRRPLFPLSAAAAVSLAIALAIASLVRPPATSGPPTAPAARPSADSAISLDPDALAGGDAPLVGCTAGGDEIVPLVCDEDDALDTVIDVT